MGAKKKPAKKGGSADDEEDESVPRFYSKYVKKCKELEIKPSPIIKQQMQEFEDGDIEFLTKFHFWDELGWEGVRAIMDALRTIAPAPYPHCKSIRLWKTFCEDEGVRATCQYIECAPNVQILELLDNKVTPLGCEFVSRILHPKSSAQLKILKMDHNPFGSEGMIRLAEGMAMNQTLEQVSLTYCNIDQNGARAIFEVLINTQSKIQELNLSGNNLQNEGMVWILKGLKLVKTMKKTYLADNNFNANEDFLAKLEDTLGSNQEVLKRFDMQYNVFTDEAVIKLTEILGEAGKSVYDFQISERVSKDVLKEFQDKLKSNKPGKKKKKKKKKS